MNLRAVRGLLGGLCLLLALALLVPAGVSALYRESSVARAFAACALGTALLGLLLRSGTARALWGTEGRPAFFRREGLAVVALAWLLASAVGAVPFVVGGATPSVVDAFFESTSGFTTTGGSIFDSDEIDALSHGILFWRCFSHWIGGAGIVLVFVTVLPAGARSLFRAEGVSREEDRSRVRDSAFSVLRVYGVLTAAHALLLWAVGMGLFDAVTHAFSSLATGGFSNYGASVAHFDSLAIEVVLVVFMVAAGMNFALWDSLWRRGHGTGWRSAVRSTEARVYLGLLAGGTVLLGLVLWFTAGVDEPQYTSFARCMRDAGFSLVSVQTCTGYATADFDLWPSSCRMILMVAAAIGACTGSTGGGIKVARAVVVARAALAAVRAFARPRGVHPILLDGRPVADSVGSAALSYFALWMMAAVGGAVALALLGADLVTATTSVISCLNNVGPGLSLVGPSGNYAHFDPISKVLLSFLMIAGRLELYALVSLFLPGFWRR